MPTVKNNANVMMTYDIPFDMPGWPRKGRVKQEARPTECIKVMNAPAAVAGMLRLLSIAPAQRHGIFLLRLHS